VGRSIVGGIAGGVVGATVMSMILVASKVVMGMPLLADFVVMGTFVGGVGEAAIAAGFAAHYLVGFVVGGIFGALVVYVAWLKPTSGAKALSIGVVFGAVVWLIVFLPVAMWGFAPIMMGMMGPAASAMLPMVLGLGFVEHLLYGAIVGVVTYAAVRR